MSELGGGVDELEFNILQEPAAVVHQERLGNPWTGEPQTEVSTHPLQAPPVHPPLPQAMGLPLPSSQPTAGVDLSQRDDSLFGSCDATLQHDEVILDFPIVGEATLQRCGSRSRAGKGLPR